MSRRLLLAAAAALFLGFAAYGSFVPFHLERISIDEAVRRFTSVEYVDPRSASKTDLVANVLLFVPIGLTLAGAIADRSRPLAWMAIPIVALFGLVLSVAIEFGQTFIVGRTPSWNDIAAESLGATIGAIAWTIAGTRVLDWLRPLTAPSTPVQRAQRLLTCYATVWLVLQVLPLDLTLRLPELAEKYRAGRIILRPFADASSIADGLVRFGAVALPAIPIGALGAIVLGRTRSTAWRGAAFGVAVVAALEAVQLLVVSRTSNVTDVISGGVGALVGAWLGARWVAATLDDRSERTRGGARRPPLGPRGARWLGGGAPDPALVPVRLRGHARDVRDENPSPGRAAVPLLLLVQLPRGPRRGVHEDPARSSGRPVAAGVLAALGASPRCASSRERSSQVCATVLFSAIELGQVFLPSRVPDDTDILLGSRRRHRRCRCRAARLIHATRLRDLRCGSSRCCSPSRAHLTATFAGAQAPPAPVAPAADPPAVTVKVLPDFWGEYAIWGAIGADRRGHLWLGITSNDDGSASAHLFEYDPVADTVTDRGNVIEQLQKNGLKRPGEKQMKIHSRIVQMPDGFRYFSSMDESGEAADGSKPPTWGGHLWRLARPGLAWEHLARTPEALIAVAGGGSVRVRARLLEPRALPVRHAQPQGAIGDRGLGRRAHLPQLPRGRARARVRPAAEADHEREGRAGRRERSSSSGRTSRRWAAGRCPSTSSAARASRTASCRSSRMVRAGSTSRQGKGRLYHLVVRANEPTAVADLGWYHPGGARYVASMCRDAKTGVLYGASGGSSYGGRQFEWVARSPDGGASVAPLPYGDQRDFPHDALLYGSIARDAAGRCYVVGTMNYKPVVLAIGPPTSARP